MKKILFSIRHFTVWLMSLVFVAMTLTQSESSFAGDPNTNDPLSVDQWAIKNEGYDVREDITDIKSRLRAGLRGFDIGLDLSSSELNQLMKKEVVVAVVDSGVDVEHEDLKTQIFKNDLECESGQVPIGEAKEDRDGNGYKGDCLGINLTSTKPEDINRPYDDVGHGTHIAGIISAMSGNGIGIRGLSDKIKILPIKAIARDERRQKINITQRVIQAIDYAVSRQVSVINLSLGWPIAWNNDNVHAAIRRAHTAGVAIVAAAANNAHGLPIYPCAYKEVICVGATQNDGRIADFTNYGSHVDLLAPGDHILSTHPTKLIPNFYSVRGYEMKSGTSQAAPFVSAAIAILRAVHTSESVDQIFLRLLSTARDVAKDGQHFASGQIQIGKALRARLSEVESAYVLNKEIEHVRPTAKLEVQFPIRIKNLSSQAKALDMQIVSLKAGVNLKTRQLRTPLIRAWGDIEVLVPAQLANLDVDREVSLRIQMNGKLFDLKYVMAFDASISENGDRRIENADLAKNLFQVHDLHSKKPSEFYAGFLRVTEHVQLNLWQRDRTEMKSVSQINLREMKTPLGFYQGDVNQDGVKEFVVLGLKLNTEKPRLIIYYLDQQLRPLFSEVAYIELSENALFNIANLGDLKKTHWIVRQIGQSQQTILVPSILEEGYKPDLDKTRKEKREDQQVMERHVYYLEPVLDAKLGLTFRQRIIDGASWVQKIKDQMGLYFYEDVTPLTTLSDGTCLFLAGQLTEARVLAVNMDTNFTFEILSWPNNYQGYYSLPVNESQAAQRTGSSESTNSNFEALFGLISAHRGHLVVFERNNKSNIIAELTLDLPDQSEHIIKPLIVAKDGASFSVILEAGQKLFGFYGRANQVEKVVSGEIARSTFFDYVASQVNLPIPYKTSSASLYVDDTQMTANSIFVRTFSSEKGFHAPVGSSLTLGSSCRRLGPRFDKHESATVLDLVCSQSSHSAEGQTVLRSIKL